MKRSLLVLVSSTLFFAFVAIAVMLYYSSSFYRGPVGVVLSDEIELGGFLLSVLVFFSGKYMLYELVARYLLKRHKTRAMLVVFWLGMFIAVAYDIAVLFVGTAPLPGSGFAFLGALLHTPAILAGALVLLALLSMGGNGATTKRGRKKKEATTWRMGSDW